MKTLLTDIKSALNDILTASSKDSRKDAIIRFRRIVLSKDFKKIQQPLHSVLLNLAVDLSSYQPDPIIRSEGIFLFGDDVLEKIIREALVKIEEFKKNDFMD